MGRKTWGIAGILSFVAFGNGTAGPWLYGENSALPGNPSWSNKVEVADINGDEYPDILFANGRGYASPGGGERNQALFNPGETPGPWQDYSNVIFGKMLDQSRAIKARDLTGDGVTDLFVANTYETASRFYFGAGAGLFFDESASRLPQTEHSFGDAEACDVDGDGDLDLVLADWGPGNPMNNGGGVTRIWINSGDGHFTDETEARMPTAKVGFSWDLECIDVDRDFDLDILVSCKSCTGSRFFRNDGNGSFTDESTSLPQFGNNYDFESFDIDQDGFPEISTINDGPGLKEHLFSVKPDGSIVDATGTFWPDSFNVGEDDNVARFGDLDSDGNPDLFIGSLSGSDRWLKMSAMGVIESLTPVDVGPATPGTLDVLFADFNRDGRIDWVQAQGEIGDESNHVFWGDDLPVDNAVPQVTHVQWPTQTPDENTWIRAHAHDGFGGTPASTGLEVFLEVETDDTVSPFPMMNMGESLFAGKLVPPPGRNWSFRICGRDAQGNVGCSESSVPPTEGEDGGETPDGGEDVVSPEDDTAQTDAGAGNEEDGIGGEPEDTASEAIDSHGENEDGVLGEDGSVETPEWDSSAEVDSVNKTESEDVDGVWADDASAPEDGKGGVDVLAPAQSSGEGCTQSHPFSGAAGLLFLLAYSFSRRLRTSPNCSRNAVRKS